MLAHNLVVNIAVLLVTGKDSEDRLNMEHPVCLRRVTHSGFAIFEDLGLLGNGDSERPRFLQLEYLHKKLALSLLESVLTNYHDLFRKARVIPLAFARTSLTLHAAF